MLYYKYNKHSKVDFKIEIFFQVSVHDWKTWDHNS